MKRFALTLAIAASLGAPLSAQDLDVELQRATQKEVVTGDLSAAIQEYRKIVDRAGSNRAVAAKGLVHIGECYQKMGNARARDTFELVMAEYADQKESAATARERLGTKVATQSAALPKPQAFEVIYVKPANSGAGSIKMRITAGGGFEMQNAPLKNIIASAFEIEPYQISGGPQWLQSERVDMLAKATAESDNARDATAEERELALNRLQSLLAERFRLVMRKETKEAPVYTLAVAGAGFKLKPSSSVAGRLSTRMGSKGGAITADGVTMKRLAGALSSTLATPVSDRTGLGWNYDFEIHFDARRTSAGGWDPEPIVTALRDQLGLTLEAQTGTVEVFAIKRLEKPAGN